MCGRLLTHRLDEMGECDSTVPHLDAKVWMNEKRADGKEPGFLTHDSVTARV